jgi:hypothetical protein
VQAGNENEPRIKIEETKAAIRDSVERAKELIVEARFVIKQTEPEPPDTPDQIT